MRLTVVKAEGRTGEESDFTVIDIADVYFIDIWKPKKNAPGIPRFHTKDGTYINVGSLEGYAILLKDLGFTPLDNVNVVNLNKILFIEKTSFSTRAYFDSQKYATVSRSGLAKVKHIPKKTVRD